ncbi:MAG TPA: aminotransferase class I/II-fold pyridoxal phosphate-dependent enzyme [Saprospiraceae bacterium]|nr:aminotransferase class I/II-fold pyridoxal phosphate-dependent enzyme [Saprospiraceae bacterium]
MTKLQKAYDAEHFRASGHQLIDQLADYLAKATTGTEMPVLPWLDTAAAQDNWEQHFQGKDSTPLFEKIIKDSIHIHHPNYMGHQVNPPAPITALAAMTIDLLNNGMGVYEMGLAGVPMERIIIREVARKMGFAQAADGIITSGGTLANLTALLAARAHQANQEVWTEGTHQQYAIMVSEQAHYSVDRAIRIMGWGAAGIIKIPTNGQFQMRTELLETHLAKAKEQNVEVLAVVGAACSTATGAYDDLDAIAEFCTRHNLWFHVDGAHGAAVVYSQRHRHLVQGIERADSVCMDFHKMLMTPALATALVFKDGTNNFRTFAQEALYLFEDEDELDWYNLAKRSFECTKTMMVVKIYSLLHSYGEALFEEYVTKVIDNTQLLYELLLVDGDFEIAMPPQTNIICFRWAPPGLSEAEIDALTPRIREAMTQEGTFYIVRTRLRGKHFLRSTLTNPFTERKHLEGMLENIKATARELRTVAL